VAAISGRLGSADLLRLLIEDGAVQDDRSEELALSY
jgi:hypothetical protein